MLEQMKDSKPPLPPLSGGLLQHSNTPTFQHPTVPDFSFEKILHTGDWESLLKYIGAIYVRPENGKFVRYTSGIIADAYTNNGVSERDYRVLYRASHDIADQMSAQNIIPDIVMGAQM